MIPLYDPNSIEDTPQPCKVCGDPTEPDDRVEIRTFSQTSRSTSATTWNAPVVEYVCGRCALKRKASEWVD